MAGLIGFLVICAAVVYGVKCYLMNARLDAEKARKDEVEQRVERERADAVIKAQEELIMKMKLERKARKGEQLKTAFKRGSV